jgi:hypothetical protein
MLTANVDLISRDEIQAAFRTVIQEAERSLQPFEINGRVLAKLDGRRPHPMDDSVSEIMLQAFYDGQLELDPLDPGRFKATFPVAHHSRWHQRRAA